MGEFEPEMSSLTSSFTFLDGPGSDKVVRFIVAIFFSVRWRSKVKETASLKEWPVWQGL